MRSSRSSAPPPPRPKAAFDAEIVPVTANDGRQGQGNRRGLDARKSRIDKDEGNRPDTTLEGLAALQPVLGPGTHHHRRQRQPALATAPRPASSWTPRVAEKRGLEPLGRYIGMAVAGTEPDEMGIGPVFAVPKLLERFGLKIGRHRPVGIERGVRGAGALLPRQARHPRRPAQRRRRRHLDRPPLRHVAARA